MNGSRLDESTFFRAVEQRRLTEGVSWRELSRRLGLSPSTFSRMAKGKRPDVDTFVKLLLWLDIPIERFIIGHSKRRGRKKDALSTVTDALVADPNLGPDQVASLNSIFRVAYSSIRQPKK